ncbi:hypothetical protein BDF22DRAFT_744847 [Syncephalis plumigaleata]|nr:hypothetical protein BDF22DRAFT_744847 [Syncephalis plumigaleata]
MLSIQLPELVVKPAPPSPDSPLFGILVMMGIFTFISIILIWMLPDAQQASNKSEEEAQLLTSQLVASNEGRGNNDKCGMSQAPTTSSQAELICRVAALEKLCQTFADFDTAYNTMNIRISKIENLLSELSNRMDDIEQRVKEAPLKSTMDELTNINARLSNTAKLSSHEIDQLQQQQQIHHTTISTELDVMYKRLEKITRKTKDLEEEKESFCQSYEIRTAALKDRYLEREQRQLQRDHWISGEELLVELEETRILSECQKLRPVDYNVPIPI